MKNAPIFVDCQIFNLQVEQAPGDIRRSSRVSESLQQFPKLFVRQRQNNPTVDPSTLGDIEGKVFVVMHKGIRFHFCSPPHTHTYVIILSLFSFVLFLKKETIASSCSFLL